MVPRAFWGPREPAAIGHIDTSLISFIRHIYDLIGWPGVVVLMAIESAAVPLPSEVIMPLAGWFLVRSPGHPVWWILIAALLGALGNTLGSWLTYAIGALGGRPLLDRYGRYLLIDSGDLDTADRWFARRGKLAVFVGRLLPVVRTFISIPAGVARMDLTVFTVLTFTGSFLWSLVLAWAGYLLGANYDRIRQWVRPFDIPIAILIVLLIAWYIYRHLRRAASRKAEAQVP
jgi:membrane protein DedA with SNARE-associated domain